MEPTLTLAMSSDALDGALMDRSRVAPPTIVPGVPFIGFATPTLRIFDAAGHELMSIVGYDAPSFADSLTAGLHPDRRATAALTLAAELSRVQTGAGEAVDLGALPAADVTLVQYGTESCPPCHAEAAVIAAFLTARPDLRATWIDVEVDFSSVIADEAPMSDG